MRKNTEAGAQAADALRKRSAGRIREVMSAVQEPFDGILGVVLDTSDAEVRRIAKALGANLGSPTIDAFDIDDAAATLGRFDIPVFDGTPLPYGYVRWLIMANRSGYSIWYERVLRDPSTGLDPWPAPPHAPVFDGSLQWITKTVFDAVPTRKLLFSHPAPAELFDAIRADLPETGTFADVLTLDQQVRAAGGLFASMLVSTDNVFSEDVSVDKVDSHIAAFGVLDYSYRIQFSGWSTQEMIYGRLSKISGGWNLRYLTGRMECYAHCKKGQRLCWAIIALGPNPPCELA